MSARAVALENVLARTEKIQPGLDVMRGEDLKQVARFWFGTTAANKFRRDDAALALGEVFRDPKRMAERLRSLPEKERQILAIFKRYGGSVSGPLLQCELLTRGLVEKIKSGYPYFGQPREADPVHDLRSALVLVTRSGGYSRYDSYYPGYGQRYPELFAVPGVLDALAPAPLLPWKPSAPAAEPATTSRRAAAEVALDLWTTAQALEQTGTWKTNRGGALPKSMHNRLRKLFSWPEQDPLLPPDLEVFYYELLRGLGAVQGDEDLGRIDLAAVERHLRNPAPVQAWHWVRAWRASRLWQDGIGAVPDRDNYRNPARIEADRLRTARELVVWGLCRVAHGPADWLDLETFLVDLLSATGEESIDFYWSSYSWDPKFKLAQDKDEITDREKRHRAFWLDAEGTWAANAIMGTLAHLALVERGNGGPGKHDRPCFRLTPLGKAVFGAPEIAATEADHDPKFLVVQPNHEVQVYLNAADASAVWPLAQMARRVSGAGEVVQTFALSRESVYQALETGLDVEAIRRFLVEHSRTGLPDNVAHSLAEWGRRREALVMRTGVTLGVAPPGEVERLPGAAKGRRVGDQFVLLPRTATRGVQGGLVRDHQKGPSQVWQVDDEGVVRVGKNTDAVIQARLAQFADPVNGDWKITAASVRRARDRGIPADQLLGWLNEHLLNELPAVMETALRNWSSQARIFLGSLPLLQVPQPQACAMILASPRFQPLLLGHVPPDWFVIRPEKQAELERLLAELGFATTAAPKLAVLPGAGTEPTEAEASGRGRQGRRGKRKTSE